MTAAIFLPGILMPAALRYRALFAELPNEETWDKELEVYSQPEVPYGYSLAFEVDGLRRYADERFLDRFHLYGHSAGGAIALAFTAAYPDRVASLAIDEPATDFSDDDRAAIEASQVADLASMAEEQRMGAFVRTLVRDGVELGPPPPTPPEAAAEMSKRPAGMLAFTTLVREETIDRDVLAAFAGPVYYSYGSLSAERWEAMAPRMQSTFPDCTVERYEGLHHMNTSHAAEPARVAAALRALWGRASG